MNNELIMTQEEKEILIKDICARLPYNVKCLYRNVDDEIKIGKLNIIQCDEERIVIDTTSLEHKGSDVVGMFPFLYPLSSMTEEQLEEFYCKFVENEIDFNDFKKYYFETNSYYKLLTSVSDCPYVIDWFIKNHFDYRGLIPMGLAIDATGLNVY